MKIMVMNVTDFGKIIADDTRNEIMDCLCCVWLNVTEVVERMGGKVNQPTVSHHLKVLEDANLVLVRQEGRQRFYTLNQEVYNDCCRVLFKQRNPGSDMLIVPENIPGGVG
jgi:ArsR family transcriptional regulator